MTQDLKGAQLQIITDDTGDAHNKQLQLQIILSMCPKDASVDSNTQHQILLGKTITISLDTAMNKSHNPVVKTSAKLIHPGRLHVFNFLDLPRELRDMVYGKLVPTSVSHQEVQSRRESARGMLLSNRQIYNELRTSFYETTPYRLIFRPCNGNCACRKCKWYFDSATAYRSKQAIHDVEVHWNKVMVVLDHSHRFALGCFRKIEICWLLSDAKGSDKGIKNLVQIADAIAADLRTNVQLRENNVELSLRWRYKTVRRADTNDKSQLARADIWYGCLGQAGLDVKPVSKSIRRQKHVCEVLVKVELIKHYETVQKPTF